MFALELLLYLGLVNQSCKMGDICEQQDRKPPVTMSANVIFAIEKYAIKCNSVNCLSWALLSGMSLTWVL